LALVAIGGEPQCAPVARSRQVSDLARDEPGVGYPAAQVLQGGGEAGPQGRAGDDPRLRPGGRVIVDSSAIVAILLKEPGCERLRGHLAAAEQVGIGAPTVVESSLVLCSRLGHAGKTLLARFLQEAEIEVVPGR
jgi:hypothetical protein